MRVSDVDKSILIKWMAVNWSDFTTLNYVDQIYVDNIVSIKITDWFNDKGYLIPVILFNVLVPDSSNSISIHHINISDYIIFSREFKFHVIVSEYIIFSREVKINNLLNEYES